MDFPKLAAVHGGQGQSSGGKNLVGTWHQLLVIRTIQDTFCFQHPSFERAAKSTANSQEVLTRNLIRANQHNYGPEIAIWIIKVITTDDSVIGELFPRYLETGQSYMQALRLSLITFNY